MMHGDFDPLGSVKILVSKSLVGSKVAVEMAGTYYVSPAMYDLIKHAETPEELEKILGTIGCIKLPKMPDLVQLPITQQPDM